MFFPERSPRFCSLVVALALALVLALSACGGGSKHKNTQPPVTAPKVLAIKTAVLKVGKVDVESAGPNAQIDPPTGRAVMGIAQKYIDSAVFAPLEKGTLGAEYPKLFDSGVKPTAIGADRGALTDLAVGKATKLFTKATPVTLSALAGSLGELVYVATDFDLVVHGVQDGHALTITRNVELTFAKTAKSWLVTAYRVQTVRKSAAVTTTTTATAGSTKP